MKRKKSHFFIIIGLFLVTATTCGVLSGGHVYVRDGAAMYMMSCSILDNSWIDVPHHPNTVGGKIGRDGKYYMPFGFLQPLLAVPFVYVGRFLAQQFNTAYLAFFAATWLNWILTGCLSVLLYWGAFQMGLRGRVAVTSTLLALFSSPFPVYSQTFFSEPMAACLTLCSFCLVNHSLTSRHPQKYLVLAGALSGFITCLRPLAGLIIPPLAIYLLLRIRKKETLTVLKRFLSYIIPAAAGISTYLFFNFIRFGNFLETGYEKLPDGSPRGFTLDPFYGAKILLFSPGKSIFVFAPLLILLPVSIFILVRKKLKPELLCFLLTGGLYLFVLSHWSRIEGGVAWGPRLFLPAIPILYLAIFPILKDSGRFLRWIFLILAIVGIGIQVTGVSINFSTVISKHIDSYFSPSDGLYQFSFNPFTAHVDHLSDTLAGNHLLHKRPGKIIQWNRNSDQINPSDGFDFWWLHFFKDDVNGIFIVTFLVGLCLTFLFGVWLCFMGSKLIPNQV